MIRDTWRAVLVVLVVLVLREILSRPQPPAPVPVPVPVHYVPAPPVYGNQPAPPVYGNERPLRRIGAAFVELGDSVIGAIRR